MLKVAVASQNKMAADHFGHCQSFEIFTVEDRQIISEESVDNPGHKPGFLPRFLHDRGVNVIIAGGMGASAVNIFNDNNIEVIVGARGQAKELAQAYLDGELESTGSVCHHEHEH